jgi:hypothetical protein
MIFFTTPRRRHGEGPFSLWGILDAIRYAIQFSQPQSFFPLTLWVVEIEATLWQPTENEESNVQAGNGSTHGTEGFSTQSKWLYLFSAVLIEVDEKTSIVATCEISGIILASLRAHQRIL